MKKKRMKYLFVAAVLLIILAGGLTYISQNMKKNAKTYRLYVTQEDDYTWAISIADENIVHLISYGQAADNMNFATEGSEDYMIELEPVRPGTTEFTMEYVKKYGDEPAKESYTYDAVVSKDMELDLKLKESK